MLGAILPAVLAPPARAKYWGMVDAPAWQESEGYTRQSWSFDSEPAWQKADLDGDGDKDAFIVDGKGFGADRARENDYGGAFFIRTAYGDAFAWDWVDEGPMFLDWEGLQGMLGGMGGGSFDFLVHLPAAAQQSELWLQYVVYLANGRDGSAVIVTPAAGREFAAPLGTVVHKQWHQIHALDDQGGSGQWWRVTEQWDVDGCKGAVYLRLATKGKQSSVIIDSVDILTRTVNEKRKG
jgi:hypothetical protein